MSQMMPLTSDNSVEQNDSFEQSELSAEHEATELLHSQRNELLDETTDEAAGEETGEAAAQDSNSIATDSTPTNQQNTSIAILPLESDYDVPPPSYVEAVSTHPTVDISQQAPYLSYLPQHLMPYPPSSLYQVSNQVEAEADPTRLFCSQCVAWTQTQTLKRPSQMQLMSSALLCFIGVPMASCLPFVINGCWEQERRCGNCGAGVE